MTRRLEHFSRRFGVWIVRLVALVVLFDANHGTGHWIVGGLLLASVLIDGYLWFGRRRPTAAKAVDRPA